MTLDLNNNLEFSRSTLQSWQEAEKEACQERDEARRRAERAEARFEMTLTDYKEACQERDVAQRLAEELTEDMRHVCDNCRPEYEPLPWRKE